MCICGRKNVLPRSALSDISASDSNEPNIRMNVSLTIFPPLIQECQIRYGMNEMTWAHWWCGLQSFSCCGHACSQQQPEASHAQFKRCLGSGLRGLAGKTLPEICTELEKSIKLWTSPPRDDEEEEAAYTLMSKTYNLVPTQPDDWMWTDYCHYVYEPGWGTVSLPSITRILRDGHIFERTTASGKLFFMSFGVPQVMTPQLIGQMYLGILAS